MTEPVTRTLAEAMDTTEPRYEWRVWAGRLDEVAARVGALSECHETRHSAEVYIVSRTATDANPKVRDRRLDIKVLRAIRDGFEKWDVHLKSGFPVPAELLSSQVLPLLGLAPPQLRREQYSLSQFLDEVVEPHPDLAAVEVKKRRNSYTVNGCIAEVSDVTIGGRHLQTVAVESVDLQALSEARRLTGLNRYDNVNYPRAIRRTLGWAAT